MIFLNEKSNYTLQVETIILYVGGSLNNNSENIKFTIF